jgi:hypothetical protein
MIRTLLACILSLSLATSGCATLLNSGPSQLALTVEPATAITQVRRSDGRTDTTVTGATNAVPLDKGHDYVLQVGAHGYASQDVVVGRKVTPAFWWDLAILGGGLALVLIQGNLAANSGGYQAGLGSAATMIVGLPLALLAGGGAIGIDASTGAMWEHDPQSVAVKLVPAPHAP